jgi:hypothetical protein
MCDHGDTVLVKVTVDGPLAFEGVTTRKPKHIDRCIAPLVAALEDARIVMRGSCCGHGKGDGSIVLADGRELIIRLAVPQANEVPHVETTTCVWCGNSVKHRLRCPAVPQEGAQDA